MIYSKLHYTYSTGQCFNCSSVHVAKMKKKTIITILTLTITITYNYITMSMIPHVWNWIDVFAVPKLWFALCRVGRHKSYYLLSGAIFLIVVLTHGTVPWAEVLVRLPLVMVVKVNTSCYMCPFEVALWVWPSGILSTKLTCQVWSHKP